MIDTNTGDLTFDLGDRFRSRCKQEDLLMLPIVANAQVEQNDYNDWTMVKIGVRRIGGHGFNTICYLKNGTLAKIELRHEGFGTSFENDDSQGRKECHDKWLAEVLGPPPYQFIWGSVRSEIVHDVKAAWDDSYICIQYN